MVQKGLFGCIQDICNIKGYIVKDRQQEHCEEFEEKWGVLERMF